MNIDTIQNINNENLWKLLIDENNNNDLIQLNDLIQEEVKKFLQSMKVRTSLKSFKKV